MQQKLHALLIPNRQQALVVHTIVHIKTNEAHTKIKLLSEGMLCLHQRATLHQSSKWSLILYARRRLLQRQLQGNVSLRRAVVLAYNKMLTAGRTWAAGFGKYYLLEEGSVDNLCQYNDTTYKCSRMQRICQTHVVRLSHETFRNILGSFGT